MRTCPRGAAWADKAYELDEAIPAAFIVALSEVYGVCVNCKCGIATATIACAVWG